MTAPSPPDRKLNLLIVASSLWIGGTETVIRHLAETIDRDRFNVSVCYLKQLGQIGDTLAKAGVDIFGIADSPDAPVDYLAFRKLRRAIRDRRIDVVHTHTPQGLVDTGVCKVLGQRIALVHTFHFGNYPHTSPRILWMERIFSRLADRLFAVGEVQRQQLLAVHRLKEDAIDVLWNGVTEPDPAGDPAFRSSIGAGDRLLIGTIATLIEQKGLRDLMAVARELRDLGDRIKFVIVGEGHLRPELEALRREYGLDDMVALTGWVTSAADRALPTFDIFFQPSLWEAMSVVTLEAMAAGKPIVTTRVGEAPHIIADGSDGVLVHATDVSGMAAALRRLIGDPAQRARLGAAARAKVQERFTVDRMTRAYEHVYLDAAARRRARA